MEAIKPTKTYSLFECIGIELEYMIVNRKTLMPAPISDQLILRKIGEITDELVNGNISWSNELVLHVLELKTTNPMPGVEGLSHDFHQNILEINKILEPLDAQLMPTAMHPLFNPIKDVKLWPHERNEIYSRYNQIFDCKGHGWGNLQSMHINLPFANDEEFYLLHEAIRHIMPLIPALTASSPIFDGQKSEILDNRLAFYEQNQKKIPSIAGKVIPESVANKAEYEKVIFKRIFEDIAPYDKDKSLQHEWLNSRGAIARFDRNAIEIRIIDLQECPAADLAIAEFVVQALKFIIPHIKDHNPIDEYELYGIYRLALEKGGKSMISNEEYLRIFDMDKEGKVSIENVWKNILKHVYLADDKKAIIEYILDNRNLSQRILGNLKGKEWSDENIKKEYAVLVDCLKENKLYELR
ncbi:glutamate--cysteine ligase [Marivirga tractuosa]|uniref:Glutamate--cysteine ligase GCS2 n=1 Tax=Marivirga tractuosa (strain ATCC 23168 / DSM 4126 / NBRC 15989 / NCIMB 1408 / VKM B-1430 / H-43) TaxID=643867 RepID=E4TUU1_MARTH|nr:glutamate-cysteine ligase family protein [Marivirga tractuosa]ADR21046.1 glutamate--cysteine ligase GCS2 [Marivirga tractuosa DSM 4126]BDD14499.1 glutamate--cysteine ligase [Marivirga tractuosa]